LVETADAKSAASDRETSLLAYALPKEAWDRLETLEHTAKIAILSRVLGGSKNLPPDAIEKLINVREAAGYLGESARSQSCGYLSGAENGDSKISLTREELVELLSQAVNGK